LEIAFYLWFIVSFSCGLFDANFMGIIRKVKQNGHFWRENSSVFSNGDAWYFFDNQLLMEIRYIYWHFYKKSTFISALESSKIVEFVP
jgi:hypothetical protein